ncbi:MAG: tandem-95 repeat protein [Verrucomicrobiales bacterium]|nr:tandem-95 repeat protein [Verrucomicrobiales bacterium]
MQNPSLQFRQYPRKVATILGALLCAAATTWSANVRLAWDPNPETDLRNYRLYRGTAPNSYDSTTDVGLATTADVSGLADGVTYYFALSAVNQAGSESDLSNEVSYRTPTNLPPVIGENSFTGSEDFGLAFVLVVSDPENRPLSITKVKNPSFGQVTGADLNWTYTPNANWFGTDSAIFSVSDGVNSTNLVVELAIAPQNDPPVCIPPQFVVEGEEDTSFTTAIGGVDIDDEELFTTIVAQPANATITLQDGFIVTITPKPNFYGADSFSFAVSDGRLTTTSTVPFTVRPVNDRPVATPAAISVAAGQSISLPIAGTDVENDILNFGIVSNPTQGVIQGTAPNFIYTANANASGSDSLQFTASDGNLISAPATITVTIISTNAKPIANANAFVLAEDGSIAITLAGSDPEGRSLTYSYGNPSHGTLIGTAPNLTYKPAANFNGSDAFTFTVNDGALNSDPATISLTVTPVNDPPSATSAAVTTNEDVALPISLSGFDAENSTLRFTLTRNPTKGKITGIAPNLVYTPNANYSGSDSIQFTVNDGILTSTNTATISITIVAVNDKPKANPRSISLAEDTTIPFTLTGSDTEKDALFYQIKTQPSFGRIIGTAPNVRYIPNTNYTGTDSFEFTVSDRSATSDPAVVSVTVTPVNDAPCATSTTVSTPKATAVALPIECRDIDGDSLTLRITKAVANGTVSGVAPNLTYTPSSTFVGTDAIEFTVSDGRLTSAVARITISVVESPTTQESETTIAKVIVKTDEALVTYGGTTDRLTTGALSILVNDTAKDGSALTAAVTKSPANGTVEIQPDGTFTYTHLGGTALTDEFTYTATTPSGDTAEGRVVVHLLQILGGEVTDAGTDLEISVATGIEYRIEVQDLIAGAPSTWQTLATFTGETDGIATVTDTSPTTTAERLYRVRSVGAYGELVTESWLRPLSVATE